MKISQESTKGPIRGLLNYVVGTGGKPNGQDEYLQKLVL